MYEANPLPEVCFGVITDLEQRHAFFVATSAEDYARLAAAYAGERDPTRPGTDGIFSSRGIS